ncbi:MAG: hypothetical protein M1351_02265 [Candidatus Thermoplasmatota archaeon]|nr:hypothetical protein [Candidatus Thermoplasmatota archaeon]
MVRSDFETITAPKSVVQKIEEYRRGKGYPSKSQALGSMLAEVGRADKMHEILLKLVEFLKNLVQQIKSTGKESLNDLHRLLESLIDTIVTMLSAI